MSKVAGSTAERKNVKLIIAGVIASVAAAGVGAAATHEVDVHQTPPAERCYGVATAGNNDCQTASNSCAATAATDRQWDAFIMVPKGMCEKISGGSIAAAKSAPTAG